MLTAEVVRMLRKTAWLLAALLLFAAANVRLRWDCEVAGETLALGCSARAAQRAAEAARAAAEEILPGEAALPQLKRRARLTLRLPERVLIISVTIRLFRLVCCIFWRFYEIRSA